MYAGPAQGVLLELDTSEILELPLLSTNRVPQNAEVFAMTVWNYLTGRTSLIFSVYLPTTARKEEAQLETKVW